MSIVVQATGALIACMAITILVRPGSAFLGVALLFAGRAA
jgi:hypothetical protein